MSDKLLISTPATGVVLLTLNRPEVLNAIDMDLAAQLGTALESCELHDDVRVIILTGAGKRAFCSGFDIHEMASFDGAAMVRAFVARDPLTLQVAEHAKPIIAALNGITYGAGALLAAAADIRVGCALTKFKVTASGYGGANATWTLPAIVGMAKAKEILMTGRTIPADEALSIGLLNTVADGSVVEAATEMASLIAANPPAGVHGIKKLINENVGRSYADGYRAEFSWMMEGMRRQSTAAAELFSDFLTARPTGKPDK